MSTARIALSIGIWLIALGVSLPAQAIEPAIKCESAKVKEAGKYHFCRMKAESKAIKKGTSPLADLNKCDSKYDIKWPRIEAKGGGACPSSGDQTSIQDRLIEQVDDLTTLLSGGSLPPCLAGAVFPPTGQTTCFDSAGTIIPCAGTGQDGEIQAGGALVYQDNGDGTITDLNTGLMWEKLSDDGSIHDWNNSYTWDQAFSRVAILNGGGGFATHTDWRVPNFKELVSILDLGVFFPSAPPAFDTDCTPTCTVTECSCTWSQTPTQFYWTSTSRQGNPNDAWYVGFAVGNVDDANKGDPLRVRAVRGP